MKLTTAESLRFTGGRLFYRNAAGFSSDQVIYLRQENLRPFPLADDAIDEFIIDLVPEGQQSSFSGGMPG